MARSRARELVALVLVLVPGCTGPGAPVDDTADAPCASATGEPVAREGGAIVLLAELSASPEGVGVCGERIYVPTFDGTLEVLERSTGVHIESVDLGLSDGVGALGTAFDARERLYMGTQSPIVLRASRDAAGWSVETYAEIPDLPLCPLADPCQYGAEDHGGFANDLVFDAAGNLYVTDTVQATIWRIPAGGQPEPWAQSADWAGAIRLNGISLTPDGATLVVADTGIVAGLAWVAPAVWHVPVEGEAAGEPVRVHVYETPPDGLEVGASGRTYVVILLSGQLSMLDQEGEEIARYPPVPAVMHDPPIDAPTSVAFDDARRSLIMVTSALFSGDDTHHLVLEVHVDDTSAPLQYPDVD